MTKSTTKDKKYTKKETNINKTRELVLMNDDIHTFDYVIDALTTVCDHTVEQATQCAFITHYKGKCDVKKGSLNELRSMRKSLVDKELKAIIN